MLAVSSRLKTVFFVFGSSIAEVDHFLQKGVEATAEHDFHPDLIPINDMVQWQIQQVTLTVVNATLLSHSYRFLIMP